MRGIFGGRPTRFDKNEAVRLKNDVAGTDLRAGLTGTILKVRRGKPPSYDVQVFGPDGVVIGRFAISEEVLMPADGRRFDDNDAVRLVEDAPSEGLSGGAVGVVSSVHPGSPRTYLVELLDADGNKTGQVKVEESGLVSRETEDLAGPVAEESDATEDERAPAAGLTDGPAGYSHRGTSARFKRGDAVRLDQHLPSEGLSAGTTGVVSWIILGPPVSYLIEFERHPDEARVGLGLTKVEESCLSPKS